MNDNLTPGVKDAMEYLKTGGLGEVIGMTSMALKMSEPVIQSDTEMAMALCLIAAEALNHAPAEKVAGRIAELEAQNERLREALELIADTDIKPFRCTAIARDALAAEGRTSQKELDDMVSSAIEAAIETSPEFNHGWRSMPDKELIREILDEIPNEYTEADIADAIYRYKVRRLLGTAGPAALSSPMEGGE